MPPTTDKLLAAVHVPIPTLPPTTDNKNCAVVVPTPTLPVKVLMLLPLCVYDPDDVIPVVAVIWPLVLTVNAFAPTVKGADGTQVPIPTLPFITVNAEVVNKVVPMPTLPLPVS